MHAAHLLWPLCMQLNRNIPLAAGVVGGAALLITQILPSTPLQVSTLLCKPSCAGLAGRAAAMSACHAEPKEIWRSQERSVDFGCWCADGEVRDGRLQIPGAPYLLQGLL